MKTIYRVLVILATPMVLAACGEEAKFQSTNSSEANTILLDELGNNVDENDVVFSQVAVEAKESSFTNLSTTVNSRTSRHSNYRIRYSVSLEPAERAERDVLQIGERLCDQRTLGAKGVFICRYQGRVEVAGHKYDFSASLQMQFRGDVYGWKAYLNKVDRLTLISASSQPATQNPVVTQPNTPDTNGGNISSPSAPSNGTSRPGVSQAGNCYLNRYSDICENSVNYCQNPEAHFRNHGRSEGRIWGCQ